jgi:tetratricopeptide (TPR) repeat protein
MAREMMHRGTFVVLIAVIALPAEAQSVAGLMRQADSAFAAENRALAEQLYRRVVAMDAEQSRASYRLGVLAPNDEDALVWFKRYVVLERTDAWGWVAVGDRSLRLGRTVEAREAYERAAKLEPTADDVQQRLARGRLRAAPALEPLAGYTRDSDGGHTSTIGLTGDVALRAGWRLGGRITRSSISDGVDEATLDESVLRLEGRPRAAWRIDLSGGPARFAASGSGSAFTVLAEARVRWRGRGAAADVRANRIALGTTAELVANHAVRNEARVGVDVPVRSLRIRATERVAFVNASGEDANRRLQSDAVAALPLGWRGEISVQYHRTGYERASTAGYFAPGRVETIESGTYWDLGGDGAVSLSFDLGAGAQRIALQGAGVGPWKAAVRGWAVLSVALNRTLQWRTELEAYSAPFAPVGSSTAPDWRYGSMNMGLQIRLP